MVMLAVSIKPSDKHDLEKICDALHSSRGKLRLTLSSGKEASFRMKSAGYLNIQAKKVWKTGTTARKIMALYL